MIDVIKDESAKISVACQSSCSSSNQKTSSKDFYERLLRCHLHKLHYPAENGQAKKKWFLAFSRSYRAAIRSLAALLISCYSVFSGLGVKPLYLTNSLSHHSGNSRGLRLRSCTS